MFKGRIRYLTNSPGFIIQKVIIAFATTKTELKKKLVDQAGLDGAFSVIDINIMKSGKNKYEVRAYEQAQKWGWK